MTVQMPPKHCTLPCGRWRVTTRCLGREVITGRRVYRATWEGDEEPEGRRVYARWQRQIKDEKFVWNVVVLGEALLPIERNPSPGMTVDDYEQDDGEGFTGPSPGCLLVLWALGTVALTFFTYSLWAGW